MKRIFYWPLWGVAFSLVGLVGWVIFVVLSVITGGAFRFMANLFGWIGLLSIPVSLVIKLIYKKREIKRPLKGSVPVTCGCGWSLRSALTEERCRFWSVRR